MNQLNHKNNSSWLLRLFCPPDLIEEIEGDLIQKFERDKKAMGERRARWRLFRNTLRFFRPGILLRNTLSIGLNQNLMLRNYLKVMLRNLMKRKVHSAINIFGLTAGIAFALLIGIFVWGEMEVNQSLTDIDQLYIVESKYAGPERNFKWFAPAPLMIEAKEQYPGLVRNYYRFRDRQITVSSGDKHFRVQSMIGDSTFFDMFGFPVLYGNRLTALTQPNSIVVTEKIARQYFDKADVVGESLTLTTEVNGLKEYIITAVIQDVQQKNAVTDFMNSDAQIFLTLKNKDDFAVSFQDDWNSEIITYIKLTPAASPNKARDAINTLLKKDAPKALSENRTIELDPLANYYLVTNNGAVQKLLVTLETIVFFILFLAIANFINITVASSLARLKEVGMRKVIGGVKSQIIVQFLSESMVLAAFSTALALVSYELLHDYFGEILNATLPSVADFSSAFWCWIITGVFTVGIVAGAYPSLYLASAHAIDSLKGRLKSVAGTIRFSRTLIGAQFLIAVFVFTISVVISSQVSFFMEKDTGYDKSQLLIVSSLPRQWTEEGFVRMESAKREFLGSPRIQSASLSWGSPNWNFDPSSVLMHRSGQPADQSVQTVISASDEDYAKVYGMKLIAGKFLFAEGETRHANSMVINETAQKVLSVHVGDRITIPSFGNSEYTISGIVKDFNFESFHQAIKPVAIIHTRDYGAYRYFSFKLAPGELIASVQEVEALWRKIFTNDPFVYSFGDQRVQKMYNIEVQLKKASQIATILILIIVLTGVLGLVALNVSKRNKEIGVRKVLGASVSTILKLLLREYVVLMIIAFAAGIPLTYFSVTPWLEGFAYHIELAWWMFVLPILSLFCITVMVVCGQSVKAALANPVKSLRTE